MQVARVFHNSPAQRKAKSTTLGGRRFSLTTPRKTIHLTENIALCPLVRHATARENLLQNGAKHRRRAAVKKQRKSWFTDCELL